MGEFLSAPIKDKVSEDNENHLVFLVINILVEIRGLWNAMLEKTHGRFSYFRY